MDPNDLLAGTTPEAYREVHAQALADLFGAALAGVPRDFEGDGVGLHVQLNLRSVRLIQELCQDEADRLLACTQG